MERPESDDATTHLILMAQMPHANAFADVPHGELPDYWIPQQGDLSPGRMRQAIIDALAMDPEDPLTMVEYVEDGVTVRFFPVPGPNELCWEIMTW